MNKKLKWTLIIAGAAVVLFGISKMRGGGDKTEKVSIEKAGKRTIVESVNASGKVYPEIEVKISPDIAGQITELYVQEGDTVKEGQVLARIYADIYALQRDEAASRVNQSVATVDNSKATLESLKASLELARQSLERNRMLYDQKVISKAELEQYEATFRTAEANYNAAVQSIRGLQANVQSTRTGLSKASKDLSRTTIIAPMTGVISSLKVKKGESVSGSGFNIGTEMMTVSDMSSLEVRVDVGENDIVKINIGDSADVEVDAYNNRKFKGVVTKIASSTKTSAVSLTANDVTNYEVRIRIDRESYKDLANRTFPFRPGMNASADIKTKRMDNVLAVPIASVNARVRGSDQSMSDKKEADKKNKGDEEGMAEVVTDESDELEEVVFVYQKDGTVKKVVVKSGIQDINYIQVLSGLNPGEEVVTGPYSAISKNLKDGMKVKVVPKDKLFEK
ncbi:MAG TPA: efflux RND transporter periplasmic adaptor subunit [Chitinophagaceae bacterium]|jgi:HlyD family secretion protein|nr:efflux RND transporter periplasmic adaptor subunit [Chitinophagaceae bacterium]